MSFNDSFGENINNSFGEENKNNNISFDGNNNNNNNISFEENNNNNINNNNISFEGNNENQNNNISFEENKNNLSFDNMKMDDNINNKNLNEEEEKENDIFNSVIPMEIQNQENQDILYYQDLLITENIKHNIYIIFNIIKKNILYHKIKFFSILFVEIYIN